MRPLRIAFIGQKGVPAQWGGVEAHVEALATRLAARGHDVVVYVRRWYTPRGATLPGVRLCWLPTAHTKHLDATVHSALAAMHAAYARSDVVHFQALGPSLFCWLPRLAACGVVSTVHSLDQQRAKWGAFARTALRTAEWLALRVPHRTLVVSRDLQRHYRDRGFETVLLQNAVEAATPRRPDAIRRELGLSGGDYLLYLGRWDAGKRLELLIDGYRRVHARTFRLVVAGAAASDSDESSVRARARGVEGVIFPGVVTGARKAELFSNALGFVSVSEVEGLPVSLLEAMSYGLPCLASDIPGHREALQGVGAPGLRRIETSADVARGLVELAALGPEERMRIGDACRRHIALAYDWDDRVDRLEALYRELVFGTQAGA